MLPQALAIINGKGGTLKTTVATNTAGVIAAAGQRVLLVDWDPQGNLGHDLGIRGTAIDDEGRALAAAVTGQAPLTADAVHEVRPGLFVIMGGEAMDDVVHVDLEAALDPIADDYDLIVLDCPPGNRPLQLAALLTSRFVVIPTKADQASIDGLRRVAKMFAQVRGDRNPDLTLLGVVLTDIGSQSRLEQRMFREQVAELFGREDTAFLASIRHGEVAANNARRHGRLVHELDRALFASLGQRFPESVPGLAGDHQRLAYEIIGRISAQVSA